MEELLELKELLVRGDISGALAIVEDLEEMSRKDIINNIRSYAKVLLLHLIKQRAENRTTRSWDVSIRNCADEIQEFNLRPKGKGYYLSSEELMEIMTTAYDRSLDGASLEVKEGRYETEELDKLVSRAEIIAEALRLIA